MIKFLLTHPKPPRKLEQPSLRGEMNSPHFFVETKVSLDAFLAKPVCLEIHQHWGSSFD